MSETRVVLNKYLQSTQNFVKHIQDVISYTKMKDTQIDRDREQIIKEREDSMVKSNVLLGQVNAMREDRDIAQQKVNEADKLSQAAKDQLIKVDLLVEKMDGKEKSIKEREEKQKDIVSRNSIISNRIYKDSLRINKKEAELSLLEKELNSRKELLNQKEEELMIKEERLESREETLRRTAKQLGVIY